MTVMLELEETEAEYLRDIIGIWIEGHDDAIEGTEKAPAAVYDNRLDLFLAACDGIRQQRVDAEVVKYKLEEALRT